MQNKKPPQAPPKEGMYFSQSPPLMQNVYSISAVGGGFKEWKEWEGVKESEGKSTDRS